MKKICRIAFGIVAIVGIFALANWLVRTFIMPEIEQIPFIGNLFKK